MANLTPIKFGSDGFRGILAREVTYAEMTRVVAALYAYLRREEKHPKALFGYDRRFMADIFAHNLARGFESIGGRAEVSSSPLTSPALAWHTRDRGAGMGVMITASHNPPNYLGVKLKGNYGGSALPVVQREIEKIAAEESRQSWGFDPRYEHNNAFHPLDGYAEKIVEEFKGISAGQRAPRLIVDYMHGSAAEIFPAVLDRLRIETIPHREIRDPEYGGVGPEPLPEKLTELQARVAAQNGGAIGLAFDGDGDRLTVIDESGEFAANHELFAIYMRHLSIARGEEGRVVGSSSFSSLLDRVAGDLRVRLMRVPVGFKAVSEEFVKGGVMLGGEESGGTGFGFWLPERDAVVMALLLLEAMKAANMSLSEMRAGLTRDYGRLFFMRADFALASRMDKDALWAALPDAGGEFAGLRAKAKDGFDGVRLDFTDGSWALFRLSGTEPLLRVYAESADEETASRIVEHAKSLFLT